MKRLCLALLLLLVGSTASPAFGQACPIGHQPGSSLLFPYFEVDTSNPGGLTTLISINNESNQARLTRVVVWTNWAIPVLAFDLYLKPFDLQTMNLRDVLNGNVPSTGEGADLSAFSFCNVSSFSPIHTNPVFVDNRMLQLRAYLTGVAGPLDTLCAGQFGGDSRARGYVTVDVVDECSGLELLAPDQTVSFTPANTTFPYFGPAGSTRIAIEANVLWGDLFYLDPAGNSAQGVEAVPITSDESRFAGPNVYTFYGRYSGFDGRDKRYPLPTLWATRFLNGGAFTGGTDLIVWRDTKSATTARRGCSVGPAWRPLRTSFLTARDEDGGIVVGLTADDFLFPIATQKISVSGIGIGANFGRMQFALAGGPSLENPTEGWVIPIMTASGRFSLDFNATPVNDGCSVSP
jgi:hypothetical protein